MTQKHEGGCHCGAVRFSVELDPDSPPSRCNCTICTKVGITTAIVKPAAFALLSGEDAATCYARKPEVGRRYFCSTCGIHCFARGHLEQLGGDFVSVNLNTVDDLELSALKVIHFDGRHDNWAAGPRPSPWPVRAEAKS